jgi:Tfp pilus assembly protein PilO
MNWSVLTKKQQQMVVVTAVLVVLQLLLMAHFLGWMKPASARGGSAKKELLELEQKLDDARIVINNEGTIRHELAQSVENLEALMVNMPTLSDRYAWAYEYVSRCATQARIELDNLEETTTIEDPKKPTVSLPYEISVSTRCGYNSLVEFLWRLEKDNPLLRIKEVTITALPAQQQSHQVRILMQWPSSVKIEKGEK